MFPLVFSSLLLRHSSALAKMKYAHRGDGGEVAWAVRGMFYRYFLVVGLSFHPAARVAPDNELSDFIIHEDEQGVWESTEPPGRLQRVHP